MTLTPLITYQESVGSVPVLSLGESNMPYGKGTYGSKVGRPPKKKTATKKKSCGCGSKKKNK